MPSICILKLDNLRYSVIQIIQQGDGGPAAGRDGSFSRHGRGTAHGLCPCWGMHPPFSFLCLAREKRMRRARWKRKENAWGALRSLLHSSELRRRPDAQTQGLRLFCPRFAHGWPRPGQRVRLQQEDGGTARLCPGMREARAEGLGALRQSSKTASKALANAGTHLREIQSQTHPVEDWQFTVAPIQDSPRIFGRNLTNVKFLPRRSLFSLDRARPVSLFSRKREKREMGGASPRHAGTACRSSRARGAKPPSPRRGNPPAPRPRLVQIHIPCKLNSGVYSSRAEVRS